MSTEHDFFCRRCITMLPVSKRDGGPQGASPICADCAEVKPSSLPASKRELPASKRDGGPKRARGPLDLKEAGLVSA